MDVQCASPVPRAPEGDNPQGLRAGARCGGRRRAAAGVPGHRQALCDGRGSHPGAATLARRLLPLQRAVQHRERRPVALPSGLVSRACSALAPVSLPVGRLPQRTQVAACAGARPHAALPGRRRGLRRVGVRHLSPGARPPCVPRVARIARRAGAQSAPPRLHFVSSWRGGTLSFAYQFGCAESVAGRWCQALVSTRGKRFGSLHMLACPSQQ